MSLTVNLGRVFLQYVSTYACRHRANTEITQERRSFEGDRAQKTPDPESPIPIKQGKYFRSNSGSPYHLGTVLNYGVLGALRNLLSW